MVRPGRLANHWSYISLFSFTDSVYFQLEFGKFWCLAISVNATENLSSPAQRHTTKTMFSSNLLFIYLLEGARYIREALLVSNLGESTHRHKCVVDESVLACELELSRFVSVL